MEDLSELAQELYSILWHAALNGYAVHGRELVTEFPTQASWRVGAACYELYAVGLVGWYTHAAERHSSSYWYAHPPAFDPEDVQEHGTHLGRVWFINPL